MSAKTTNLMNFFRKPEITEVTVQNKKKQNPPKSIGEGRIKELSDSLMQWHLSALCKNDVKLHGAKKVTLIRNQLNQLEHQTLDVDSDVQTEGLIPIPPNLTLEETAEELANKYEITNFDKGHPCFEYYYLHYLTVESKENRAYRVKLLRFQNELIWQIFNHFTLICERVPLETCTLLHEKRCAQNTKDLFKNKIMNSYISLKERVDHLRNFTIKKIEKNDAAHTPWIIHLIPCNMKSEIDPRIRVSKYNHVLTMIADGRGIFGNHAVLVIEGLDDHLKYFMHTIEFTGLEVLLELNRASLKYEERTEIHQVSSKKTKRLIEAIEKIKSKPKEYTPEFFITGKNSKFFGKHNCCTWAIQLAKRWLKVDFGSCETEKIFTYTKAFTKKETLLKKLPTKTLL